MNRADDPEDMPLLYRFGYTKNGKATVLGDYTDKNILMAKVPPGNTNYTASELDLSMFVNETANLMDDRVENPPLLILQAFITDNLYAEQLREIPTIVRSPALIDAEGNDISAASYASNFIDEVVTKAEDVGDLSSVTRNLKGTTDIMNEVPVVADDSARRRMLVIGDRRLEEAVDEIKATRDKLMSTLASASTQMQLTENVVTQQSDTVGGASANPDEMSEDSVSGGGWSGRNSCRRLKRWQGHAGAQLGLVTLLITQMTKYLSLTVCACT
eukprot:SAG31_NODE_1214_length_9340_cov_30.386799_4_plen_272_part_00